MVDVGLFVVVECCVCGVEVVVVDLYLVGLDVLFGLIGSVVVVVLYIGI